MVCLNPFKIKSLIVNLQKLLVNDTKTKGLLLFLVSDIYGDMRHSANRECDVRLNYISFCKLI